MLIEQHRVAEDFDRAAVSYDEYAALQHMLMVEACLLASMYFKAHDKLLDIGCGTGSFAAYAKDYYKDWNIVGVDIAPAMVEKAKRHAPSFVANAEKLPFDNESFDGIFSGVCLQWVENKTQAFREMWRVTKPGSTAIVTSFGTHTLRELRTAMRAVDMPYAVMEMLDINAYSHIAKQIGWRVVSAQQSVSIEYAPTVEAVMRQLKRIGATNKHKDRPRHLFGTRRFERMIAEYEKLATPLGIPVTWDVISLVLEKA